MNGWRNGIVTPNRSSGKLPPTSFLTRCNAVKNYPGHHARTDDRTRRAILAEPPRPRNLLRRGNQRQLNKTRLSCTMVNPLRRLAVLARPGPENTWQKGLRITVVEREPARLDLHHDGVAREKNMIRGR